MIGVLIPAHNEEQRITDCLLSIRRSVAHARQQGVRSHVTVVLDRCTDSTPHLARQWADTVIELHDGNVGIARSKAAEDHIEHGRLWLASTDADSIVPEDWLWRQWTCGADVFCGIVQVDDWEDYDGAVIDAFGATRPVDGHPHVHGANLGISASAYRVSGGFEPLSAHEDVQLIRRCEEAGLRIARLASPAVITSARRDARARGGFGDFLLALEQRTRQPCG